MDCTYSIPLDYQGNVPSNDITPFNFSHETCTYTTMTATPAAYIDIASNSAIAKGVYDIFAFNFVLALIIALGVAWYIGNWMYKR
jgi:hypothetical protein